LVFSAVIGRCLLSSFGPDWPPLAMVPLLFLEYLLACLPL
jgi:hypothetical protein